MRPANTKKTKRHLPHWSMDGATYYITFRLKQGTLSKSERQIVFDHITSGDPIYYRLFALVVMPDHVHLIAKPNPGIDLPRMSRGIKGVAARKVNQSRKTTGPLWLGESFDRVVRSERELHEKAGYLIENPLRAGLVKELSGYPYLFCRAL